MLVVFLFRLRFITFNCEDALCPECDCATTVKRGKGALQGFKTVSCQLYLFSSSFVKSICTDRVFMFMTSWVQEFDLWRGSEWVACVLGLEIIVILHISALNLCGAQTLVIAVASWAMLFEEIIMDSDNEGKRAWLHPTEYFFFFTVFPPLWKQLLKTAPRNYLSICLLWCNVKFQL